MTSRAAVTGGPVRKSVWMMTAIVAIVLGLGLLTIRWRGPRMSAEKPAPDTNLSVGQLTPVESPVASHAPSEFSTKADGREAPATSETMRLIKVLGEINLHADELTIEKADNWRQHLERVIEEGRNAVPALDEYFGRNENVRFDTGPAGKLLGETTLRLALIKVLFDIPTPDNVDLQEKVLQSTSDPEEIALIARQLEQQEPGEHYRSIIQAAKRGLQVASVGQLADRDTAPLVQILEGYGIPTK